MSLDFELSEEHLQIQESAKQMMKRFEGQKEALKKKIFEEKIVPDEVWQAFAEAGFLGALIPEEYGGSNMGLLSLVLAFEQLGKSGFGNEMLVLTAMDTACIVRNGSPEMKREILPKIAAGELMCCFAVTEPDAGSNTFRVATNAKKDGDDYVLNGQKVFITGADQADKMLMVARTTSREACEEQGLPKAFGLSLFLVDTKTPGITMQKLPMRGIKGATQWAIFFEDARVPKETLVGEADAGTMVLFNSLNPERILAAASAVGITEHLLAKSVDYSKERRLFKERPIGAYQAISHPLAEIKMELECVRMATRRAALAYDQGADPTEVGFWANTAKYKGAEMWISAVDRAIQTHGGYGFSEEYGIILYWEAARLMRTAPVTKEMILNFVSEHTLGLPRGY